jgi:MraZ protein
MRALVGGSKELKIDRQGRVLVPRKHLGMAGITDRATLVGVIDRVEIWHPDRYADSLNEVDLEGIAEQLDWL